MKKILTLLTVLVILLTACTKKEETCTVTVTDGVSTYLNKEVKTVVPVNAKKIFSLTSADSTIGQIGFIAGDTQGNLFIMDLADNQIKKIDANGKLVAKFGNKGTGPGEYQMASALAVVNNRVAVVDPMQQKLVLFDMDGKFENFITGLKAFPSTIFNIGTSSIVALLVKPEQIDGGVILNTSVALLDSAFHETKTLTSISNKVDQSNPFAFQKSFPIVAASNSKIYVSSHSIDKYEVDGFGIDGALKDKVIKNFMKISYSQTEIAKIQKKIDEKIKQNGIQMSLKYNEKYKSALSWLGVDRLNRLWVAASIPENKEIKSGIKYNIFENGKLLGSADFATEGNIQFVNDRLIEVNSEENTLSVYSY